MTSGDALASVQRLGLWGFGREGKAVYALARARSIPEVMVYSTGTEELPEGVRRVRIVDELLTCDLVVRSPGVPIYDEDFCAVADDVPTTTLTNLWMEAHGDQTIAIAGTKGKSTLCTLVVRLMNAVGLSAEIGGNVGVPLDPDRALPAGHWVVAELSSFQISDLRSSPALAVLTSFHQEHLDWHRGLDNYRRDKLRLLAGVDEGQRVATGQFGAAEALAAEGLSVRAASVEIDGTVLRHQAQPIADVAGSYLGDQVGVVSAQLALEVLLRLGVDIIGHRAVIADALQTFEGLPHRRQVVLQVDNVRAIDDTLATTPIAAARTIDEFGAMSLVAIVGGGDRGLDFRPLIDQLTNRTGTTRVICVPDTGLALAPQLQARGVAVDLAGNIEAAVDRAAELLAAVDGEAVLLLSPASPSHNQYANYQELGQRFAARCTHHFDR